jgi:hypothetical protein
MFSSTFTAEIRKMWCILHTVSSLKKKELLPFITACMTWGRIVCNVNQSDVERHCCVLSLKVQFKKPNI